MCGIVGIVDFTNELPPRSELLSLCDSLAHRGPDDRGLYTSRDAALGSRRLAVIDLSPQGHQPMANEDETVWAVFNGEIYNFRELRAELEACGHRFRSQTDSEVIIHAYEQWADDSVRHLTGMFALAVYDERGADRSSGRVLLARDRLGVKPLWYTMEGGRLVFASEAHVIYRFVEPRLDRIDRAALAYYLAFGYLPPDRALVRGVCKLPPGHALSYSRDGTSCWRYWQVSFRPLRSAPLSETLRELDVALQAAVVRRLESDVPLGCFLSGGIDSGLVTAIAARKTGTSLETYSVGFAETAASDDERPLARLVARMYGTLHHEIVVEPMTGEILPRLLWHVGEPFADVSVLPTFTICQVARERLVVALTGDGGDESFAGYGNVRNAYLAQKARSALPEFLLPVADGIAQGGGRLGPGAITRKAAHWWSQYVRRSVREHYDLVNHWGQEWQRSLFSPEWLDGETWPNPLDTVSRVQSHATDLSDAETHLFTDLHLRLPGDYLTKVDIASGMVGLELRSPFLDHEVVELATRLPISMKLLHWRQKGLLRQLAGQYLPDEVTRQPKRGFSPPVSAWLRAGWKPLIEDLVVGGLANRPELFERDLILRVVGEHLSGTRDHGQRLWSLLCLEVWWQLFIDRSLKPEDAL